MLLRKGYGLTILFLYNAKLNKPVEDTATVRRLKPYDTVRPPYGDRREMGFTNRTGAVSSSQAKCKLGITTSRG